MARPFDMRRASIAVGIVLLLVLTASVTDSRAELLGAGTTQESSPVVTAGVSASAQAHAVSSLAERVLSALANISATRGNLSILSHTNIPKLYGGLSPALAWKVYGSAYADVRAQEKAAVLSAGFSPFNPQTWDCTIAVFVQPVAGAGCLLAQSLYYATVTAPNAASYANNVLIGAYNSLSKSASEYVNIFDTAPELLQQLAGMAVSEAGNFVDASTWSTNLSYEVAALSGVGAFDAGYSLAVQNQEFQDWGAILKSWNGGFDSGGEFSTVPDALQYTTDVLNNGLECGTGSPGCSEYTLASNTVFGVVSNSWWVLQPRSNASIYLYLPPGTQVGWEPNAFCVSSGPGCTGTGQATTQYANLTDLNTGFVYPVRQLQNDTFFNLSRNNTLDAGVQAGDLVLLTTNSGAAVFMRGGFPLQNVTGRSLVPYPQLLAYQKTESGTTPNPPVFSLLPAVGEYLCWTSHTPNQLKCDNTDHHGVGSGNVYALGNATAVGTGAGALGNQPIETTFPRILWNLTNSALTYAHEYWTALRLITENGTFPVPPGCIVPEPQDALPGVTNTANFGLNYTTGLAIYYAWLNSIGHFYGSDLTGGNFCGIGNSTFTFRWMGNWHPWLNITANVYFGNANGSIYPNGTPDPFEHYNATGTWVVQNSSPTYVFPSTFQMNVPVGKIYPIPYNDPTAMVFPNWPGNSQFGVNSSNPAHGIPSYFSAEGQGNRVTVAGNLTNISSGHANRTGFAIYISSCKNNGTAENPCKIPVNFVNNLTFAQQYGTSFTCPPGLGGCTNGTTGFGGGGGGVPGVGDCGTGSLNAWYDAWFAELVVGIAGPIHGLGSVPVIGGFFEAIACGVGWIVAILLVIVVLAVVVWVVRKIAGD